MKKSLAVISLMFVSHLAQAGVISYNGYSRDDSKNYVSGGGLEWLKWDITRGMSINNAVAQYAAQGWTLAKTDQMAALFNTFQFGKTDWHANESGDQQITTGWSAGELAAHTLFVRLFGATGYSAGGGGCRDCYASDDPYAVSYAFYGSGDNRNLYKLAAVEDDSTYVTIGGRRMPNDASARLFSVGWAPVNESSLFAVALVRPTSQTVSSPATLGLFTAALLALGLRRRKVS